jgi:hemoglobin
MEAQQKPSLYQRLGGAFKIAILMDDFIDRILSDPRFAANPHLSEATANVSKAGLKYLITEWTCSLAGGPQAYTGRDMGASHRHLMITESEWQAFMDDFRQSLDACKVREPEKQELTALLEGWKKAIVVSPT